MASTRGDETQPVRVVAVVGATASGKSDLSLDLAQAVGGEVVNTDAMQVYAGMDIGTAKLPVGQRRGVPHHLLDILAIGEPATVADFQQRARAVVHDCLARGVVPILVGGSALYTRAVLDRFEFPGTDAEVRSRWERALATEGAAALHRRLARIDPEAAARIIASNGRRIVRALEVWELTGKPFSSSLPSLTYHYAHARQIGLQIPRDVLDERIALRVDRMWREGFVDEVRAHEAELRSSRTARAALGYQQVLAFLAGEISEDEARLSTVRGTRRFARRQESWFRKDPRVSWIPWDSPDRLQQALRVLGS